MFHKFSSKKLELCSFAHIATEFFNFAAIKLLYDMNKLQISLAANAVLLLLCGYLFFSKSKPSTAAIRQNMVGQNANQPAVTPVNPLNDPIQPVAQPVDPANATSIAFEEANNTFKFGTIKEGEKVRHKFKFKNSGTKPLSIADAKASCGCTVPQWPKEPIAPGATSTIDVEFDSKGKVGSQTKTVTVTANTNPAQTILTISGEVIADPNAPKEKKEPSIYNGAGGIKVQ